MPSLSYNATGPFRLFDVPVAHLKKKENCLATHICLVSITLSYSPVIMFIKKI
jgi:hypothetical protein